MTLPCGRFSFSCSLFSGALAFTASAVFCCATSGAPGNSSTVGDGLLIVAPRTMHASLAGFVAFKQRELKVELAALEDALAAQTGADDAERLKRFLFDRWSRNGVRYVLLVGDADVLPVRYMVLDRCTTEAYDYAFYPSDLYYGDVARADGTFDDWNGRKDGFHAGYYGEVRGEKNKDDPINFDGVDYRPELAVGRWPVSTPEEAAGIADKTMAYERAAAENPSPALHTVGLVATGGWIENRAMMDAMGGSLPTNWTIAKRYWSDAARNDKTAPPNKAGVIELLNHGVGLVLHSGHGSDDCWDGSICAGAIGEMSTEAPTPVMFSAGCSTARFATLPPYEPYMDVNGLEHRGTNAGEVFTAPPPPPDCYQRGKFNRTGLGESLVKAPRRGAVAYIGCNTGSQPCGMMLMEGFVTAVSTHSLPGRPGPRLGDCWTAAVAHYHDAQHLETIKPTPDWYPASIFFQGMKFMVFGDPSLVLPGTPAS